MDNAVRCFLLEAMSALLIRNKKNPAGFLKSSKKKIFPLLLFPDDTQHSKNLDCKLLAFIFYTLSGSMVKLTFQLRRRTHWNFALADFLALVNGRPI
jgi:hypothetical protein